jgi:nucleotide-binding universal stress UspA family protein
MADNGRKEGRRMFHRILIPLDGSERAQRAVPLAAQLARATGSTVVLLHVIAPPLIGPTFLPPGGIAPVNPTIAQEGADAYLTSIASSPELAGLAVQPLVLIGTAGPTILEAIETQQADLVVLSSHGRTGRARWVLGSVAVHLTRQSPVSTLVLHASGSAPQNRLTDLVHPLRVLVTLDGSNVAEAALGPAVDLAIALGAARQPELHLLLVVDQFAAAIEAVPEVLVVGGAEGYLQRVAERLMREHPGALRVTWTVTASNDIAGSILAFAEPHQSPPTGTDHGAPGASNAGDKGFDLLVMATHGLTGFTRWALGSVTERVLSGTQRPLLIVRPRNITPQASPLAAPATGDGGQL